MSLKQIHSQDNAIDTFQRSMRLNRLSHAYIFAGIDGVGKKKTAIEWAKTLLCESPVKSETDDGVFLDSCGKCESCLLAEANSHPDIKLIYKELIRFSEKAENRKKTPIDMPKDVIDEFVVKQIANKPKKGNKVIYIIDEAEKLNAASQNALLKTLEEPPPFCVIILLTNRLDKLLPTTLSRSRVVRFGSIDENIVVDKLEDKGLDLSQAIYWARLTDGSLGKSLELSKLMANDVSLYEVKKAIAKKISSLRLETALETANSLVNTSKDIAKFWSESLENVSKSDISRRANRILLRMVMSLMSDAMKINIDRNSEIINSDQRDLIETLANAYDIDSCIENIQKVYQSMDWVDSSVNERLIFEEMLLKFTESASI